MENEIQCHLIPSVDVLWERFVERHASVLVRALGILSEKVDEDALLGKDEDSISEILWLY